MRYFQDKKKEKHRLAVGEHTPSVLAECLDITDEQGNIIQESGYLEIDKTTFDNLEAHKIEWDIAKQKFVDVIVAPPTKEELEANYHSKVEELIRKKYSMSDELGILRQKDTKVEEFEAYNAYCEQCKAEARREIYG